MPSRIRKFRFGLAGWPVRKTLSPVIFNFLFRKAKIRGTYGVFKLKPFSEIVNLTA